MTPEETVDYFCFDSINGSDKLLMSMLNNPGEQLSNKIMINNPTAAKSTDFLSLF